MGIFCGFFESIRTLFKRRRQEQIDRFHRRNGWIQSVYLEETVEFNPLFQIHQDKRASAARNWTKFAPQTDAKTFALSFCFHPSPITGITYLWFKGWTKQFILPRVRAYSVTKILNIGLLTSKINLLCWIPASLPKDGGKNKKNLSGHSCLFTFISGKLCSGKQKNLVLTLNININNLINVISLPVYSSRAQ